MSETTALKFSAAMCLVMAALGIGFAAWTESQAILLDGFFSLINFVASLITLRVARLVEQPPDERFHFGYAQFEPFLNTIKGLVVLLVAGFAGVTSALSILEGGRALEAGPAVIYALIATIAGFALAALQRRAARRHESPLLEVESRGWFVDGAISGLVAVAFAAALLMERGGAAHLVPYVDPVLVLVLVLAVAVVPLRIVRDGLRQLLGFAPEPGAQREIRRRIDEALADVPIRRKYVRMHQVGRYLYVLTQVVVEPDFRIDAVEGLDTIRQKIADGVEGVHPRLVLDTLFTGNEKWVE